MKEVVLLIIILLLSAIASAETVTIFSGTVQNNIFYATSENQPFTVTVVDVPAVVTVRLPQFSIAATNNSCSNTGGFRFCANNIAFSHYNYTLPSRMAYKVDITLTTEFGEMALNRTISPTELYVGQKANVSIEIRNKGMVAAENVTYSDSFPSILDVFPLAVSECKYESNKFTWHGNLQAGMFVRCYALLQGRTAGTGTSSGTLTYLTRDLAKTLSSSVGITVKANPLKVTYTGNNITGVGENTTLHFNLSTIENLTLGSLWLNVSPSIWVVSSSGIQQVTDRAFFLASIFDAGDSKAFELNLRPMASGTLPIKITYKVFFDNMIQDYTITPEIVGVISELQPSVPTTSLTEGDAQLNVLINNPTNYSFKNITVKAGSPVNQEASFSDVEAYGHRMALLPFAAAIGTSNVTIKVTYYSVYKEKFEKTLYAEINISKAIEKAQTVEVEQQTTNVNNEYPPDYNVNNSQMNTKYVAIAGILFVIGSIIFWVLRRRHQDLLLGA